MRQWESKFRVVHLLDVRSTAFTCWNFLHLQQDGASTSSMTGSHVTVTLGDGTSNSDIPVFPVHIMRSTSRVVTNPNPKVLDRGLILFKNLFAGNNFTNRFLQFLQFLHVIPES